MKKLPTNPIEAAYVYYKGERAVGIPNASFRVEMFIDPSGEAEPEKFIEAMREVIKGMYRILQNDPPTWVKFDFEINEEAEKLLEGLIGNE
jgi:hypothetical protein